jgi:hypothetical protein
MPARPMTAFSKRLSPPICFLPAPEVKKAGRVAETRPVLVNVFVNVKSWPLTKLVAVVVPTEVVEYVVRVIALTPLIVKVAVVRLDVTYGTIWPLGAVLYVWKVVGPVDVDVRSP